MKRIELPITDREREVCRRKVKYASELACTSWINRVRDNNPGDLRRHMRAYQCRVCRLWHVTTKGPRR